MSTHARIMVLNEDNKTGDSIYLHYDGYISHALRTLEQHYNTPELARALIELGDLSILDDSIECPDGHTFENPVRGYTVAYRRDRGEALSETATARNTPLSYGLAEPQYGYIYTGADGGWEMTKQFIRNRDIVQGVIAQTGAQTGAQTASV